MTNSEHVLQPFLPQKPDLSYNLREGTHNRSLITKTIDLTERDFLIRRLLLVTVYILSFLRATACYSAYKLSPVRPSVRR